MQFQCAVGYQNVDADLRHISYLCDLCCPVSVLAARRVLRSTAIRESLVPRVRLAIIQRRALLAVGPSACNDLLFELRSFFWWPTLPNFTSLKSFFFVRA